MNPLISLLDNAIDAQAIRLIDARALSHIDRVRISRLQSIRQVVWSRLHELNHQGLNDQLIAAPPSGAMSSPAYDNLLIAPVLGSDVLLNPSLFLTYVPFDDYLPKQDVRLIEQRKALRRLLRLLNKVITIVLRRGGSEGSRRRIVFRLRAFFVVHGNHPPDLRLRDRLMPEGCTA